VISIFFLLAVRSLGVEIELMISGISRVCRTGTDLQVAYTVHLELNHCSMHI
jgi:hypothetical protein